MEKPGPYLKMSDFFNLHEQLYGERFSPNIFAHLGTALETWILALLSELGVKGEPLILGKVSPLAHLEGKVFVAEGAHIEPFAYVKGPTYIGPKAEIRQGAYIRGGVFVGTKAVVGHTTEVKGSMFLDGAKAGHFAYVGDSILGREVNLGAGTKLANFKFRGDEVFFRDPDSNERQGSGLRKFGSIIGDQVNTGCNSVLDPGTLLMPKTAIFPCKYYRGTLKEGFAR